MRIAPRTVRYGGAMFDQNEIGDGIKAGVFGRQPPCFDNRTVGAIHRVGEDKLGSVGTQNGDTLRADVFRQR